MGESREMSQARKKIEVETEEHKFRGKYCEKINQGIYRKHLKTIETKKCFKYTQHSGYMLFKKNVLCFKYGFIFHKLLFRVY